MALSLVDQIWNRAALEKGGESPRAGDIALSALLLLHGMTMNGGIDHAVDELSHDQFEAGVQGFRYFGLSEMADMLSRASEASEEELESFDIEYGKLIPSDRILVDAFKKIYGASPDAFAP